MHTSWTRSTFVAAAQSCLTGRELKPTLCGTYLVAVHPFPLFLSKQSCLLWCWCPGLPNLTDTLVLNGRCVWSTFHEFVNRWCHSGHYTSAHSTVPGSNYLPTYLGLPTYPYGKPPFPFSGTCTIPLARVSPADCPAIQMSTGENSATYYANLPKTGQLMADSAF